MFWLLHTLQNSAMLTRLKSIRSWSSEPTFFFSQHARLTPFLLVRFSGSLPTTAAGLFLRYLPPFATYAI
jgi:hypothetical protein